VAPGGPGPPDAQDPHGPVRRRRAVPAAADRARRSRLRLPCLPHLDRRRPAVHRGRARRQLAVPTAEDRAAAGARRRYRGSHLVRSRARRGLPGHVPGDQGRAIQPARRLAGHSLYKAAGERQPDARPPAVAVRAGRGPGGDRIPARGLHRAPLVTGTAHGGQAHPGPGPRRVYLRPSRRRAPGHRQRVLRPPAPARPYPGGAPRRPHPGVHCFSGDLTSLLPAELPADLAVVACVTVSPGKRQRGASSGGG
jgi:hypothetical protein